MSQVNIQEGSLIRKRRDGQTPETGSTSVSGGGAGSGGGGSSLKTENFSIEESAGKLVIKHNGTTVLSISSAGYLKAADEIEGGVTP